MKALLTFALIAGFVTVAQADKHQATHATAPRDCTQIKDQKQKTECEASQVGNTPAAAAPAVKKAK